MLGKDEIEHRFGFHKATIEGANATLPVHSDTRLMFREFAEWLDSNLPDGRAKSVAMTELENASMWSHKAIAEMAPLIREGENLYAGLRKERSCPRSRAQGESGRGEGGVSRRPLREASTGTSPHRLGH